jgi:hypothetical protein
MIDVELVRLTNQLKARFPCNTESVDRTPLHNAQVGGAKNSWHLSTREGGAKAIDLSFDEVEDLLPAAKYAKTLGFGGIEVDFRNNHLHLDLRPLSDAWHVVYVAGGKQYLLDEYLTLFPLSV